MIYYNENKLIIRTMIEDDINMLHQSFYDQGWKKDINIFKKYYSQQQTKERIILIAQLDNLICGYVTLKLNSYVGPFKNKNIPEVIDLNVFIRYQKSGIGNKLLDIAEEIIKSYGFNKISLAVGLHQGYGQAQRIYIKRGYIFDGSGVWYNGEKLEPYSKCENNDDLVLYLSKEV